MDEQIIDVIEEPTEETIPVEEENVIVNTGGTQNYNDLYNKPQINDTELEGNLSLSDLGIDQNFVKDNNYVHTDNNYTTADKTKLASLENYDDTEIKADISDLETNKADKSEIPDVSHFITNTVNDLVNYYTKTQTYTKTEVNDLISAISTMDVRVVQVLPTEDISTTTIYLVPKQTPATQDVYDEYIYVSNAWEHIGSTDIDLSDYITTSDLNTALSNYTTTSQLTTLLNAKQNTIDSTHKLNSDLVDDTNQTNKFVTTNEKTTWNSKVGSSYISNIWYGTEAEYNAITEKDSNTLYLLEE